MANTRIMTRLPTSPGEMLHEEFLVPMGLTQGDLASHIKCDVKTINRIVNGHTSLTASMALRLGAALGTTPQFWLNLQESVDIFHASKELGDHLPKRLAAIN